MVRRYVFRSAGKARLVARSVIALLAVGVLLGSSVIPDASAYSNPNAGKWDDCGNPFLGQHNRPGLYLYEHPNYEGKCSRLTFSVPNLEFLAFVGGLTSSIRIVVPHGMTMGVTFYPGPFYGPVPDPEYVTGAFPGAATAGFVRIYGYRDLNNLPLVGGRFINISDRIKSVGIAVGSTQADFSQPVFGPECPPVGRYCWISSRNPLRYGSLGAVYVPNANAFTGPVDLCSIWKVGCGPNPTGTEQSPSLGGGTGAPPASGMDGRFVAGSLRVGDRYNTDIVFVPWTQFISTDN